MVSGEFLEEETINGGKGLMSCKGGLRRGKKDTSGKGPL